MKLKLRRGRDWEDKPAPWWHFEIGGRWYGIVKSWRELLRRLNWRQYLK